MSTAAHTSRSRHAVTWLRLALLGACTAAIACGSGDAMDLVERFDEAELRVETRRIDIGTPPARRHLTGGWLDFDERWLGRSEETFVWSGRWGAEITFHVFERRDLPVAARGWPRLSDGVPAVGAFTIRLNDVPVHQVVIEPGSREYRFSLPAQLLQVGRNRLLLEYEPGPRGFAHDDRRQFAWDWFELARTVVTDLPRSELPPGVRSILVPYLSEVSYRLPTPDGGSLELAVDHFGPPWDDVDPGRLLVRIRRTDELVSESETTLDRRADLSIDLPAAESTTITFITLPPGSGRTRAEKPMNEQIGGAALIRPRIE